MGSEDIRKLRLLAQRAGLDVNFQDYDIENGELVHRRPTKVEVKDSIRNWKDILKNGVIGKSVNVPLSSALQNTPTGILQLSSDDEVARTLGVTLFTDTIGSFELALNGTPNAITMSDPAVALVEWGSGGTFTQAEIDFGNGVQFSLVASSLKISAFRNTAPDSPDVGTLASAKFGAFISLLPVANPTPVRRSRFFPALAGGAAVNGFNVTLFSTSFVVERNPMASGFTILGRTRTGVLFTEWIVGAGAFCPKIEIPNAVKILDLTNNGAAATNFNIMFDLAI